MSRKSFAISENISESAKPRDVQGYETVTDSPEVEE
jgi:hypothetical protein